MPIKVIHLRSSAGFYGAERVVVTLMRCARDSQIDTMMACIENYISGDRSLLIHAQEAGLKVVEVPCKSRLDLKTIKEMMRLCREEQIDIIHSHDYKSHFYAAIVARLVGCKQVATLHGKTLGGVKNQLFEKLENMLLHLASHITVVSEPLYESLSKTGLNKKLSKVANGVDDISFNPEVKGFGKQHWGFDSTNFIFGTIARMSEEKGHEVLLEAFARLASKNDQVRLLLVGNGPLKEQLLALAEKLTVSDKINFAGSQVEIERILNDIDCYVSSSHTEGMPMSILEAMATALPIVATNVGAIGHLLRDDLGKIVSPADVDGLARGMQAVLDQQKQMKKVGQKCRERVAAELSAGVQGREYAAIYQSLLNN